MWCVRLARARGQEQMRKQLVVFSAMMCAGSFAGAVTWGLAIQSNVAFYAINGHGATALQGYTLSATASRFYAGFLVLYGVEFLCLIICKLLLLGQLAANAAHSSQANVSGMSGVRRRWLNGRALPIVYRVMAGAVVVGSIVGVAANIVAAVYSLQSAALHDQAAAACDAAGNATNSSLVFYHTAIDIQANADTAQSVEVGIEALTLLLVSFAFIVIVSWSAALVRIAQRVAARALLAATARVDMLVPETNAAKLVVDTAEAAVGHRWRLTAACVIVLVTFPARAAFDLLYAYSSFADPYNPACSLCGPCQSNRYLIRRWIRYTPEFQPIAVALSSPVPLTWSLWLISKAHARARLIAADVQRVRAVAGL